MTPPRPLHTPASYPEGARGAATVELELLVDREGAVTRATVLRGEAPFADAALLATRDWRFEPARRGEQAVMVKIRYRLLFKPEREHRRPAPPPAAELLPAPATGGSVEEVVVTGERPVATYSMSAEEARQLPGGFGDPLRSIEVMPGVAPIVSGLPLFFVRGAPPGNVGFFIDGIRVPLLYHGFFGPSVIHPALMDRVELYPGGYPARYGRYAGAIVAADTVRPSGPLRGEATVRLLDAGALVEAPVLGGFAVIGGRYSYTGLILSALTEAQVEYWDYQLMGSVPVNKTDQIGLFAFGAFDFVGQDSEEDFASTEFHRLDLRYDKHFKRGKARVAATVGSDRTRASQGFVTSRQIAARTQLRQQLGSDVRLDAGADMRVESFGLDASPFSTDYDDLRRLFPPRDDQVFGAYASLSWQASRRVSVVPGVRADLYRSQGESLVGIDPRLAASFQVSERLRIVHALGIAHQTPNFVPNVPGAQVAGLKGGLQRGVQASSGVELALPDSATGKAAVFRNATFKLTDPISISRNLALDAENAEVRSIGSSVGLELELRRPLIGRFGGLLSYTLSQSTRSYLTIRSRASYDRTHVLTGAVTVDLGKRWYVGAKGVFYSGVPGSRVENQSGLVFDQSRARPFFRVDLRAEKRFPFLESGHWSIVAELLNASASTEVIRRTCNAEVGCRDTDVGPIFLPNIGVSAHF